MLEIFSNHSTAYSTIQKTLQSLFSNVFFEKKKKKRKKKNTVTFRRHSVEPDKVLIEERLIV